MKKSSLIFYENNKDFLEVLFLSFFTIIFLFIGLDKSPLIDWDENHATEEERKLAIIQNQKSGISLLVNNFI